MPSSTILTPLFPALLGAAAAQTTLMPIFFPLGDSQGIVADVQTVKGATTSLLLKCPAGTNSDDCGLVSGIPVAIVSKTIYEVHLSRTSDDEDNGLGPYTETIDLTCNLSKTTEADCKGARTVTYSRGVSMAQEAATLSGEEVQAAWVTATVTSGAEKLKAQATPTGPASNTLATVSKTGSQSSGATGSHISPTGSATGSATNASGTAGAPQHTGAAARFAVSGAAAGLLAVGGAALFL